jgi:hypothetical protein
MWGHVMFFCERKVGKKIELLRVRYYFMGLPAYYQLQEFRRYKNIIWIKIPGKKWL